MFDKSLPMTGFEPQISGVGGNRSTNWATPLPQKKLFFEPDGRRSWWLFSAILLLWRSEFKYFWSHQLILQSYLKRIDEKEAGVGPCVFQKQIRQLGQ